MLRGVSLAPQQRLVNDPLELPTELVNSIIGVSVHTSPDYGSTGNTGNNSSAAALLSTSAQQSGESPSPPSFLTRLFRFAKRRYQANVAGQVPVFDANGNLTASQTGVNTFRFRSLSLFYFFRSQSWTALITYSILVYLLIVLLIAATYYMWGKYCGAGLNMVMSIYFTVVSLAANGGYLGEDEDTMTDSTHLCYRGRTAIVMVCSYVNIVFVGLVAALVVGKAEYTGKLGHRVVFSDFCTLTSIPGRVGQYRLTFRIANVDNSIPLAHGQLRVFCVTAEPLREYRLRQKHIHLLKNSAPLKSLAKSRYGSVQQLLPGGEATNSFRGAGGQAQPLTEAMLEGCRATHQIHHHERQRSANNSGGIKAAAVPISGSRPNLPETLKPLRSSSGVEKELHTTRVQQRHQQRCRNPPSSTRCRHRRSRGGRKAATSTLPSISVTEPVGSGGGSRSRRGCARGIIESPNADNDKNTNKTKDNSSSDQKKDNNNNCDEVDKAGTGSNGSSPPGSSSTSRTPTSSRSSATSSRFPSVNSSHSTSFVEEVQSSDLQETVGKTRAEKSTPVSGRVNTAVSATAGGAAAAIEVSSDVTNSSTTSRANSELYAAPPTGGVAKSLAGTAGNKRTLAPASMTAAAAAQHHVATVRVEDEENDDCEVERVRLRVQEIRWSCAEEGYLDHGESGQLSLWYPATITHTIDERSPLYTFMQLPHVAASLKEGPSMMFGSAQSDDSSVQPPSLGSNCGSDAKRHRFQLVAVFDATEMESGSTITAKHTYTTVDIVAHYKFSDRLVHMQSDSGEVMLDFHYFNALLPMDLVELSTTDSEV